MRYSDILNSVRLTMFKVKIGTNKDFGFSEYPKITLKSLILVQNFSLILKKQELANSEHVALSYDDFVILTKTTKSKLGLGEAGSG